MTVKIIYNDKLINNATAAASITSNSSLAKPQDIPKVTVTSEQRKALKDAIFNQVVE
ncbi:hypothetical protein [Ruminococcus sp.]